MATFKFGRQVNIHWNGFDVKGPADTVFSIPDQLYEEFEGDIRGVEPSLTWIDINEFQTLKDSVPTGGYVGSAIGVSPISVATSSNTATISLNSGTALNGYILVADGTGGTIWNPASTSGLTSVVGVSPMSTTISGGTVSVILNANYQTAGTYVTGVSGTAPITASGTTSITVGIDQASLTAGAATTSEALRTYVKNSSGSTITKGQVVYVTGADGTNALIGLATASTEAGSSKTLGIAANTMTQNAFGYVIENGQLSNIDTSAATAGSSVWLGNTPGSYVFDSPPAKPANNVYLGVVTKANVSTGEILVKVQNGYELNELHDVNVTGVSTALPLVYNSTSDSWIHQALTSVGIADNAIVTTKILDGSVTSAKIATGSVGSAILSDNAVVASKILDGAVTSSKIGAGAINSTHIGANAVVLGDIAAGAVDSAALANNAVVAAKIAAAAVGTAAISSGAATSGQLLQANGSGGVAFATVASAGLQINAATQTVINGALVTSVYNSSAAKTSGTVSAAIALDTTSNRVFQITDRREIKSFSAIDGSAISTSTITAVVAAEQLQDMAFGGSKLIVISNQTASGGASKYYVIDPSTLTVQNSGNLVPTGTVTSQGDPKVKYDNALGEFVVFGAYGTSATSVQTGGYIRTINPSTYSTRTADNAAWESAWGDGTRTFPVWINVNSANRWAIGSTGSEITFWSDSGAATNFATQTGSADFSSTTGFSSQLFIDSSDNTNLIYAELNDGTGTMSSQAYHIKFSEISSAYNSTNVNLSSLLTVSNDFDLGQVRGTDLIYKTIGGRQWVVAPVSLVNHVYASTRTSSALSGISSDFLTDSPWTLVTGASNPSGANWTSNWTNSCDIGYDGTEWYVIHATSNTSFHGVVKQKVRAVQTVDLIGTTVTSPSIVSPGSFGASNSTPISSLKTSPSNILATFTSGDSASTSSNALFLVGSGATWILNVYPGFSATGTNTTYAMSGRMIIRS